MTWRLKLLLIGSIFLLLGYSIMGKGMNPINLMIGVPVFNNPLTTQILATVGIFIVIMGYVIYVLVGVSIVIEEIKKRKRNGQK